MDVILKIMYTSLFILGVTFMLIRLGFFDIFNVSNKYNIDWGDVLGGFLIIVSSASTFISIIMAIWLN